MRNYLCSLSLVLLLVFGCVVGLKGVSSNDSQFDPEKILVEWQKGQEQCLGDQQTPDKTQTVHIHRAMFRNPVEGAEVEYVYMYWDEGQQIVYSISWIENEVVWHFVKHGNVWKQLLPDPGK